MTCAVEGRDVGDACFGFFPFQGDFRQIVMGVVSFEYLRCVADVLVPAIDVLSDAIENGERSYDVVNTMLYAIAAHGRLSVALAYEIDIIEARDANVDAMVAVLDEEWVSYVQDNGILLVKQCGGVASILGDNMRNVWCEHALATMASARDLLFMFQPVFDAVRVISVGSLLVQSDKGKLVSQLSAVDFAKPVLSRDAYTELLHHVRDIVSLNKRVTPSLVQENAVTLALEGSLGIRPSQWMWAVLSASHDVYGYCYQMLLKPSDRFSACLILGENPVVADLLMILSGVQREWCGVPAVIDESGSVLHVVAAGNCDLDYLSSRSHVLIGMPSPTSAEPDYYARALIDDFIKRHRKPLPAMPPVDAGFEQLTIAPMDIGERGFVDVSRRFYAKVGEPLSPRASAHVGMVSGLVTSDEYVTEIDSDRVRALNERLSSGAVVDESYYARSRRRFLRKRQRPKLDASEGRCYHVFGGFPSDGGGTTDCWIEDDQWDIPGWVSYVAWFRDEQRTVAFVAPAGSTDVRIDCTGIGTLELGSCRMTLRGTVLWFSNSIKMQVATRERVSLRVSVPESGSSLAIGADMRRYMHLPGYTVVARNFDISSGDYDVSIDLDRNGVVNKSGCQIRHGNRFIERGRHRFKVSGLVSGAVVKMAIKADPVEALDSVSVCGMRLKARSRDYITVLYDASNAGTYVSLHEAARVHVSVLQVTNHREFDLVVQSLLASQSVS